MPEKLTPSLDAPATSPEVAAVPMQNITINMVTPQSGEATEGLSEIESGGKFIVMQPDPKKPGAFIRKTVNAQGQPLD